MSHPFAAAFGGRGKCAFCSETKLEGDHRELTPAERADADRQIDKIINLLTGTPL